MTLLVTILPAKLLAQNEATQGKWEWLTGDWHTSGNPCQVVWRDDKAVRWRYYECALRSDWRTFWSERFLQGDQDWLVERTGTRYARDDDWRDIYGIHAALMPVVGESDLRHGWVALWGYGEDADNFNLEANAHHPLFPSDYTITRDGVTYDVRHFLHGWGITPFLFWHAAESADRQPHHTHGYVR